MTGQRFVGGFAVLNDRVYAPTHMWVQSTDDQDDLVCIGLDDYLQQTVGLITKVTFPESVADSTGPLAHLEVTHKICEGETCVYRKATVDLPFPLDGEVVEVNDALLTDPFLIQEDHAQSGWLVKMRLSARGRAQLTTFYRGSELDDWLLNAIRTGSAVPHA